MSKTFFSFLIPVEHDPIGWCARNLKKTEYQINRLKVMHTFVRYRKTDVIQVSLRDITETVRVLFRFGLDAIPVNDVDGGSISRFDERNPCLFVSPQICFGDEQVTVDYFIPGKDSPSASHWIVPNTIYGV